MTIRIEKKSITLSVRDLIHFHPNPRKILSSFPLPQRGMLGKRAQTKLQESKRRSFGLFHKEKTVSHTFRRKNFNITLQGRIDGIYELPKRIEIEEIKTVIFTNQDFQDLNIESFPEYTEQLLIYCYLYNLQKNPQDILPIVTLVNLVNDKSRSFKLNFYPEQIKKLIYNRFDRIIHNIHLAEKKHKRRLGQLSEIQFRLPEAREGQNTIMQDVTSSLQKTENRMITAPTGTGKTAAVLFPVLKYAVQHKKNIVYLTSKSTQHHVIKETLKPILQDGLDITVCFLRASKHMCANDVMFCHEDYCPYISNYYDPDIKNKVMGNLLTENLLDGELIFAQSTENNICPAEMMFDLAAVSDIIVGDYNYIFDPRVQIKRLFQREDLTDWILIIDEAHNLYQRAIDILSPKINRSTLTTLSKAILNNRLKVFRDLKSSISEIENIFKTLQEEGETHYSEQQYFTFVPDLPSWKMSFHNYEIAFIKYLMFKISKNLLILDDPFEEFYFRFRGLIQIAGNEDEAFIPFYNAAQKGEIKIECCNPSGHISEIIQKFHSVFAMSATLDPITYYQEVLGFPQDTLQITEVSSPFSSKNRQIIILPNISTYYRDRMRHYECYAGIIKEVIAVKNGNYIVFCPSFEFLQNVYFFLGSVKSDIHLQKRQMTIEDRDDILHQFTDNQNPKILLAVMGGIFSEGVDFKGNMCIGVIIFSPALPQMSFEHELIREYYDQKKGQGFNYAYLYPGINKVIQSVGRLIRSQEDKGIIVLAGERFAEDEINQLFPDHWFENEGDVVITDKLAETIKSFWRRFET